VVALLDAGQSLGPPLVVPPESERQPPDDPREALDHSCQHQLEVLQKVRRGVSDVATARKRVELQVSQLQETAEKLARKRQDTPDPGNEDLALEAQAREAGVREQLSALRHQLSVSQGDERRLTAASQRLMAKVDAFRTRTETLKATYTAAEASRAVREAFADLGEDASDLELPDEQAEASEDGSGPADQGGVPMPPGMMELRPGAPVGCKSACCSWWRPTTRRSWWHWSRTRAAHRTDTRS
jgi:phage shock protein A